VQAPDVFAIDHGEPLDFCDGVPLETAERLALGVAGRGEDLARPGLRFTPKASAIIARCEARHFSTPDRIAGDLPSTQTVLPGSPENRYHLSENWDSSGEFQLEFVGGAGPCSHG
jgi:hypothetical protein